MMPNSPKGGGSGRSWSPQSAAQKRKASARYGIDGEGGKKKRRADANVAPAKGGVGVPSWCGLRRREGKLEASFDGNVRDGKGGRKKRATDRRNVYFWEEKEGGEKLFSGAIRR